MKKIKSSKCKTCNTVFTNKYNNPGTYCGYACKNRDPELLSKSNLKRKQTWDVLGGHPLNSPIIKAKKKATMLERYNVAHALQSKEIYSKMSSTKFKRYGDSSFNNSPKGDSTRFILYGSSFVKVSTFLDKHIELYSSWDEEEVNPSNGSSEVANFIRSIVPNISLIEKDTSLLNGGELDIFLPDFNLAIEFVDNYSQINSSRESSFHVKKTKACSWRGVELIHITEYDWINRVDIVKSILRCKLGRGLTNLDISKCSVMEIPSKVKKGFMQTNHIQGNCRSGINLGLFYGEILVGVMLLNRSKFGEVGQFEILRFSLLKDYSVEGGFSKMVEFFKAQYVPTLLISYINRNYSSGSMYSSSGFIFTGFTKPDYSYIKGSHSYPKQMFSKRILNSILPLFNKDLTEKENMEINGFVRVFNTGSLIFTLPT